MDDNTAKVLMTAIVSAFAFAVLRRLDRVRLNAQRVRLDVFGVLKFSIGTLTLMMRRRRSHNIGHQPAILLQGDCAAIGGAMSGWDTIVVSHPDSDHLSGFRSIIRCPHHGSRRTK